MVNFDYLGKGLIGLARAHGVNTMSGHLGAAVVAGYFIAEEHTDLDDEVYRGIEKALDRIIQGESVFAPRKNSPISVKEMFDPFPKEKPNENLIDGLAEALSENITETRQSGHNVIFASIAIRALKDHPDYATPSMTDGLRKLMRGFNGATPGNGYYGKAKGRIDGRKIALPKHDKFPPYADLTAMAKVVFDELIAHADERRVGFGGLVHIVNHAAALTELARYGYGELAKKGLAGHHQHMRLWKTLPNVADEPGQKNPTKHDHDPRKPAYWKDVEGDREPAQLTHRVKTRYGFDTLAELIEDPNLRNKGHEALRFLI